MSHKDIKAISDAYLSIYESEEQLDEARNSEASALVREIKKMREQDMKDILDLIDRISVYSEKMERDTGDRAIQPKDYKEATAAWADLNNALRSLQMTLFRVK